MRSALRLAWISALLLVVRAQGARAQGLGTQPLSPASLAGDPGDGTDAAAVETPAASDGALPADLRAREAALDAELARVQRNTRLYLNGWLITNSSLAAAQVAIALSSHDGAVRSNYLIGAGLSAAGLGVLLFGYSWPGYDARARCRDRPSVTPEERRAKIACGERVMAEQRQEDLSAGTPLKHAVSLAVAAASGVRAGFSFDSVAQGIGRALFVGFVLEMQIFTRPGNLFTPRQDRRRASPVMAALSPWIERHGQGLSLVGRF
jgi:hypothetical protein